MRQMAAAIATLGGVLAFLLWAGFTLDLALHPEAETALVANTRTVALVGWIVASAAAWSLLRRS